ncbi:MAG TPA: hypothetical protein VD833_00955 [Vicinamibacterales bacterium]|nr:hypothetical protein [Vicinamibacterales bacterium]
MQHRLAAPDRRASARGAPDGEPSRTELVSMVLGTYHEMPGLSLHLHQAARLFGLRPKTCQVILEHLVTSGRLQRLDDGQYSSF